MINITDIAPECEVKCFPISRKFLLFLLLTHSLLGNGAYENQYIQEEYTGSFSAMILPLVVSQSQFLHLSQSLWLSIYCVLLYMIVIPDSVFHLQHLTTLSSDSL